MAQSLKNQATYGNIAEVIVALGEELSDISIEIDKLENILADR